MKYLEYYYEGDDRIFNLLSHLLVEQKQIHLYEENFFKRVYNTKDTNSQINMYTEEVGETLSALNKWNRGRDTYQHFIEELADVFLTIQSIRFIDQELFDYHVKQKTARFKDRYDKEMKNRETIANGWRFTMIRMNKDYNIAVIRVAGTPTLEDIKDTVVELHEHQDHTPNMKELWDIREASLEKFNAPELESLAYFLGNRMDRAANKVALVVGRDLEYGVARMWDVYASHPAPQDRQIFKDMDEAFNWLMEDKKITIDEIIDRR